MKALGPFGLIVGFMAVSKSWRIDCSVQAREEDRRFTNITLAVLATLFTGFAIATATIEYWGFVIFLLALAALSLIGLFLKRHPITE
jgi:fatty acid desaturase